MAKAVVRERFRKLAGAINYIEREAVEQQYRQAQAEGEALRRITSAAKAILCTSASVGPALRDERIKPVVERATTVVVDEAGSVDDRHVLPIIMHCPLLQRMVLVGDTKQLGVFTYIRQNGVTADVSSLMLRLEQQGIEHRLLTLQYRMPPALAAVISERFYDGRVQSAFAPLSDAPAPMFHIDIVGAVRPEREGSTSMVNEEEAKCASTVALSLTQQCPDASIVVLCLHAAQKRRVEKLLQQLKNSTVEVLTGDASQGREWDHVIISLTSVEVKGSVTDLRKQCVMLSRAKISATLIAHPNVVALLPALAAFREAGIQWPSPSSEAAPSLSTPGSPPFEPQPATPLLMLPPAPVLGSSSQTSTSSTRMATETKDGRCPYFAPSKPWEEFAASLAPVEKVQRRFNACLALIKKALMVTAAGKEGSFVVCAVEAAGSHAKGTDTAYHKDLDVVVKIEEFDPARLSEYLSWVEEAMIYGRLEVSNARQSNKAFQFELKGMAVDILVTGDLNQLASSWPACFANMSPKDRDCWSVACTDESLTFMQMTASKQPLCKEVTRIAKYWRDRVIVDWPTGSRPSSFLLQLLVCNVCFSNSDFAGSGSGMVIERLFTCFLQCIVEFEKLDAIWPGHFDSEVLPPEVMIDESPLILDPTNPHNNVAKQVEDWGKLAERADQSLKRIRLLELN